MLWIFCLESFILQYFSKLVYFIFKKPLLAIRCYCLFSLNKTNPCNLRLLGYMTSFLIFHCYFVDMGSMYLKPYRTQHGYALFVVEFATVACAVKQKDGPQLALYIKRLLLILDWNLYYHKVVSPEIEIEAKLKFLPVLDIVIGLHISCTLPCSNPARRSRCGEKCRSRCGEKCRSFKSSFSTKVATLLWCGHQVSWGQW